MKFEEARGWFLAAALLAISSGCGGVISKQLREEAVPFESFRELRETPERYRGKTVILGGEIIETRNKADGTTLAILEKPLERGEKPKSSDETGGRFLVRFPQYLDPVLFAAGRKVTVAGTVVGVEEERIGERPYPYVVLNGREVHLWQKTVTAPPTGYPYDPWYPWWYEPHWGRRPWH